MYNLTAYNANAFALTFAFAPSHTGNASKAKRECKPTHTKVQTFVQTLTDITLNVNRFGQSVCELQTTHLRTDRRATDNKGLKEMAGEVVNQTFVHLINSNGRLTVCASKPPLL